MPARHSTPASPSATQAATSASQSSPAWAVTRTTPGPRRCSVTPRVSTRTAVPSKPASATTRLEPPASSSTGSASASAARTASASAASSRASVRRRAGPPRCSVVNAASGGWATAASGTWVTPRTLGRAPADGQPGRHPRAGALDGLDPHVPAGQRRALVHPDEPEPARSAVAGEALPVVAHVDHDLAVALGHLDRDVLGARVAHRVRERLLHDPVDRPLEVGLQ